MYATLVQSEAECPHSNVCAYAGIDGGRCYGFPRSNVFLTQTIYMYILETYWNTSREIPEENYHNLDLQLEK